ncbi:hypothetical protein K3725_08210 [Leisingera sp. S132]|uniref:hypothetical protein n=1 Tax=Leisingera sp. S132 TaxID=2867016 RepID=UPI0021A71F69|nr:hypothetical protein [Leisingera sp. S132]UWQ80964.1 hypothetical protein K3725_08210 [Leisingera sp. S132]
MKTLSRSVFEVVAGAKLAALLVLPLPSFAATNEWTCVSSHGCVATTPCAEKRFNYSISRIGETVHFASVDSSFDLRALKSADGAILRAYGQPIEGQGVSSLTLFDDLTFVYSGHVSVKTNPETGQYMGLAASVLGTCEMVRS